MQLDPHDISICLEDGPVADSGSTPMATPIVQTSLFAFPDFQALLDGWVDERKANIYSRGQNPTVEVLERKLAALERGEACKCLGSGMGAIAAVMFATLRAGDHILFVNHTYGPTMQLADQLRRFGIEHDLLLDTSVDSVRAALQPRTRLVWLESPGTMTFRQLDLAAIAQIARAHGAVTCIDNSWATPLLQKPLELGVDIVVHSLTKYVGGHSDVVAGAVISSDERMREIFYRAYMLLGAVLHPFDAWLLLRGLRTLPTRLRQHEASALKVAEFLRAHDAVERVFHPAFDEGARALPAQLKGYSGLFSFELKDGSFEHVQKLIDAVRLFRIGVSWGGVESLIIAPNRGTNLEYLDRQRMPHGIVRLSIGLEDVDSLIDDLRQALAA
jgi:cystathionine beta-lyase/cystathionine gamma-synthase